MSASSPIDRLYATPQEAVPEFVFDARVAAVFPDMIRRSVPGYMTLLGLIAVLARRQSRPGARFYDLGCSLGAATLAMRSAVAAARCRFVAVDNAEAMIQRAADTLQNLPGPEVDLRCQDIRDSEVTDASMVVLNYTLQFIPLADRLPLLQRVRQGLRPDGVLVLSEKVRAADSAEQALLVELHEAFKRANGYSELEISQKRAALEHVLIPETLDAHRSRLQAAGFRQIEVWFRSLNFVSLLARP